MKGAATVTAGLALSGALGGCASDSAAESSNGKSSYAVYDTDLLFIGGGYGSLSGIYEAAKNGRKVTVVDKGPYRASGGTGMNWATGTGWFPMSADGSQNPDYQIDPVFSTFVTNKMLHKNAWDTDPNYDALKFYVDKGGECYPVRTPDGKLIFYTTVPIVYAPFGFPRHDQDQFSSSPLVTVHDRTMITDLLINNGKCVGAMGIHLPTGEFCVYRANAVIHAAGSSSWIKGWNTVSAGSIQSPDNTSDVEMAAYRHGARVGDAEYCSYDLINIAPSGIAYSYNAGIGGDMYYPASILDKDKVPFLTLLPADDQARLTYDRGFFGKVCSEHLQAGKGTPNGGFYIDLSSAEARMRVPPYYTRSFPLWKDEFGIDVTQPGTYVEVGFDFAEHGGAPVIDENAMTDIPGLFCTRGAGVQGDGGGTLIYINTRISSYAVRSALKYLASAEAPSAVDFTPAESEFARLAEMRTRTASSGGLRPHVVRQNIQKTCGTCLNPLRETAKLEAAAAELARIRSEDLPKQVLADTSATYNTEWRMAIENYNMIEIAEMTVNASLTRQESRGYYRPDYPEKDDVNWRVMLGAKLKDGAMTFEKIVLPELPAS